ncbi:protein trichome birefringence-like 8 [Prosopis cineraria]|uniref:protein trichome birefringence-like 8 n=1 Tax=Prosopis cineraria TaxID=364024 RepID=UPI0024107F10|nr:protein trichome birefringence-like 8 [Prosopis cineraria]XP_054796796.1 protein trichome birefringence-like 8 [Prosopis cineraria]
MKRELTLALPLLILFSCCLVFLNLRSPFDRLPLWSHSHFYPGDTLQRCDYSNGRWVWDEASSPSRSYNESCPFLDPGFRCRLNRRPDETFRRWRWQPHACHLPRFNATDLLERSRDGRIVFAGDSMGRNQWESLLCMLVSAVSNASTIYEVKGKSINKHKGYFSMRFQEFNLTVEYYRTPFLSLLASPPPTSPHRVQKVIRLDKLHWYSNMWVGADVLVFNSAHWWNPDKTTNLGCYFQEGANVNMSMDVKEAFRRSLQTWKSWALNSLDPDKSFIFFRSFSPVHYRGGKWNEGGGCDNETEPEKDLTRIETEPCSSDIVISEVVKQMDYGKWKVHFLNITNLSEIRKDGHPSKYREEGTPPGAPQDCSHWCLPGVPDTWNELLYAQLISKQFGISTRTQKEENITKYSS